MAGQHLHLPVQRHVPGELPDDDVGDQRRGRHAAVEHPRARRRLHHTVLAAAAGVLRSHGPQHPDVSRHAVQRLEHVLPDPMQTTCAAGTLAAGRLDHLLHPRQVLGKVADVAAGLASGRPRSRSRRPLNIVSRSGRRTRFQIA